VTNVHELVADQLLNDILRHPPAAAVLADTREELRRSIGGFDRDYVAAIGQIHALAGSWPMEQVAAFLSVHAQRMSGRFGMVTIEVGEPPGSDSERAVNAECLATLPHPFCASVDINQGCSADGDGELRWTEPITINRSTGVGEVGADGKTRPVMTTCLIPPTIPVPLEIGYSKPSVILNHLSIRHYGVARWPYGAPYITLFLNFDVFAPLGELSKNPLGL
jgi:hypothetical protein